MAKLEPLEVNPYFSENHTLPYAPFGSQYETPGMGVLDLIMTNDDGNDTYMTHGVSRLEKLAHGMHMLELWHKTSKVYNELSIRYFIPMKKENSTCEIASAALGTLFLCCVRV